MKVFITFDVNLGGYVLVQLAESELSPLGYKINPPHAGYKRYKAEIEVEAPYQITEIKGEAKPESQ